MKPYLKYKDSGVEWIGKVPDGWEILPIKYVVKIPVTDGPHETPELLNEGIPFISAEAIKNDKIDFGKKRGFISIEEHKRFSEKYKPQKGDIYMIKSGATTGNVAVVETDDEFNIWSPLAAIRPDLKKTTTKFLFHFMKSINVIENLPIVAPSIEEQISIAAYLDRKTAQIDDLISKKQKLIELLKEERAAIINQAVTKGLNPDAPMKDSGIEWLGEIPAHWEVKRLKHIAKIILGKMLTNVDKGDYHYRPYLRAQNISWEKVNVKDVKNMWFSKDELHQYRLNRNDLLVSEGGEVGRTSIWDEEIEECYIQNSVHKVTMEPTNDPFFFLYTFCLFGQKGVFESVASRISIAHLTKEKLKETVFPVPPKDEQERISKFIGTETSKIDQTISKIEKQIGLLKEFRTALISEVVTGKIDVRDEELQ
jgi:type I restriction enzyme S subunit